MQNRYETEKTCTEYLLFHYGSDEEQMPWAFGPKNSLHFPVRCVEEGLSQEQLPANAKALDLGCAVGRSSFELTRYCGSVKAIDRSHAFIALAKRLQQGERVGTVQLPEAVFPERVEFRCDDALGVAEEPFDLVLAANLLCRLSQPRALLESLPKLVRPGGLLILATPYSWLEEFTPQNQWLTSQEVQELLQEHFTLRRSFDLPFLIREHLRKYDWGVSQVTVWKRN